MVHICHFELAARDLVFPLEQRKISRLWLEITSAITPLHAQVLDLREDYLTKCALP